MVFLPRFYIYADPPAILQSWEGSMTRNMCGCKAYKYHHFFDDSDYTINMFIPAYIHWHYQNSLALGGWEYICSDSFTFISKQLWITLNMPSVLKLKPLSLCFSIFNSAYN